MSNESFADYLAQYDNPVTALREKPFLRIFGTVIPGLAVEWTNWRKEQEAWSKGTALLDQSHHMDEILIKGPDKVKLLSYLSINNYNNFTPEVGKQFVAVTEEGHLVGDGIAVWVDEETVEVIGDTIIVAWVQFHIDTGDWDVTYELDPNSAVREGAPKHYRYELQGPTSLDILEAATGAPIPDSRFFGVTDFTIAGHRVRGIRHGMVGQPGFELFGPWEHNDDVLGALMEAGKDRGLEHMGSTAYFTCPAVNGWWGCRSPDSSPTPRLRPSANGSLHRWCSRREAATTPRTSRTTI